MVYDSLVSIQRANGSLTGVQGECLIGVDCLTWHFVSGRLVCDTSDPFPSTVPCWTTSEQLTPVCDQPGSNWKGALAGTIISALFAVFIIAIAVTIEKGYSNQRRVPDAGNVEVVGVITGPAIPVVRIAEPIVVGSPITKKT
jgi:hypothetical protein